MDKPENSYLYLKLVSQPLAKGFSILELSISRLPHSSLLQQNPMEMFALFRILTLSAFLQLGYVVTLLIILEMSHSFLNMDIMGQMQM